MGLQWVYYHAIIQLYLRIRFVSLCQYMFIDKIMDMFTGQSKYTRKTIFKK